SRANENAGKCCGRNRDVSAYVMRSGDVVFLTTPLREECHSQIETSYGAVTVFSVLRSRNGVSQPVQTSSVQQRAAGPGVSVEYISEVSKNTQIPH
ncbi:uncharacterized, partial [Tachysurus ichikawai]